MPKSTKSSSEKELTSRRKRQSAGVKAHWASLSPAARKRRIKASVEARGLVYRPKK